MEEPTKLEAISGSLVTEGVMTLVSVFSGTPLSALLPILTSSLASGRQEERVRQALAQIDSMLRDHQEELIRLSDAQYKLINEAILAVLQTTEEEKLDYLRRAVSNSLTMYDLEPQEATILGRIIRDISVQEADFLIQNFAYKFVWVSNTEDSIDDSTLRVRQDSEVETTVTGLISLGLLAAAGGGWDDDGKLRFSSIVAKLIAILKQ